MTERLPDSSELRELLRSRRAAVLALASGGCARYIFSTETAYVLTDRGELWITYDSANPHHHHVMAHSAMTLRLLVETDPDGTERSHLVLTGHLVEDTPTPPGAGHARAAPSSRRYRFATRDACVEFASGRRIVVDTAALGLAT